MQHKRSEKARILVESFDVAVRKGEIDTARGCLADLCDVPSEERGVSLTELHRIYTEARAKAWADGSYTGLA